MATRGVPAGPPGDARIGDPGVAGDGGSGLLGHRPDALLVHRHLLGDALAHRALDVRDPVDGQRGLDRVATELVVLAERRDLLPRPLDLDVAAERVVRLAQHDVEGLDRALLLLAPADPERVVEALDASFLASPDRFLPGHEQRAIGHVRPLSVPARPRRACPTDYRPRSIWVQVKKAASLPAFSIRTSQTCVRPPRWSGRAVAMSSSPSRAAPSTFVFSSTVVNPSAVGRLLIVPHAATVSAKATQTPPCT